METTPAQILNDLGYVLAQNRAGDQLFRWVLEAGFGRANVYELWFLNESVRAVFPVDEREHYSRAQAGELRTAAVRRSLMGDAAGTILIERLRSLSAEFDDAWDAHEAHDGRSKVIWLPSKNGPQAHQAFVTVDQATGQRLLALQGPRPAARIDRVGVET